MRWPLSFNLSETGNDEFRPCRRAFPCWRGHAALIIVAMIFRLCAPAVADEFAGQGGLARGISIHGALNWPEMTVDRTGYVWPPFSSPKHQGAFRSLEKLKRSGLDFVRLTVDPAIFLAADPEQLKQLLKILNDRIRTIRSAGLSTIVDLHPIRQNNAYRPVDMASGGALTVDYKRVLTEIAQALLPLSDGRIVLELMNEPQMQDWSLGQRKKWQAVQREMFETVRRVNSKIAMVLTFCCSLSTDLITDIDIEPYRNADVYFTFHYYLPFLFTHQGSANESDALAPQAFADDVRFPMDAEGGQRIGRDAFRRLGAAEITPENKALAAARLARAVKALSEQSSADFIVREFDRITAWARQNKIHASRILLGEFGVMRPRVDPVSRYEWTRVIRSAAEERGFAWAYWSFDGARYMGLQIVDDSGVLDQDLLQALGLKRETPGQR